MLEDIKAEKMAKMVNDVLETAFNDPASDGIIDILFDNQAFMERFMVISLEKYPKIRKFCVCHLTPERIY